MLRAYKQATKQTKERPIPLGIRGGAARSLPLDAALTLAPKETEVVMTVKHKGRRAIAAGDQVHVCGKRKVLKREDEVVVATQAGWILAQVADWSRDGWVSLKLIRTKAAKKNVYYLGAKDGRLSRNRDGQSLNVQFPKMEEWILDELNRYSKLNTKN
jgi:hypothetical protein